VVKEAGVITFVRTTLLLTFSLSLGFAQGPRDSVDPFDIQQRIASADTFDFAALWRTLGIPAQLKTVWSQERPTGPSDPASRVSTVFSYCTRPCVAEISRENLDGDPDQELILKVVGDYGLCRFLFFKPVPYSPNRWRFLGYADDQFSHEAPGYRVRAFNNRKRFFVMHAEGAWGTGVSLEYARWSEVSSIGVREVLTQPESGTEFLTARSVHKTFSSSVSSYTADRRGDRFTVSFTVKYSADYSLVNEKQYEELNLFTRVQRAVYFRPTGGQDFALVPRESDITSPEIRAVFSDAEPKCAEFIDGNVDDLLKIARGPKSRVTEWVERLAEACEPSSQRTTLLQVVPR
jgi:hypothetical protein